MNTWIAILPWLAGLHLVLVILVILRLAMNSHLLKNLNDVVPAGDESLPSLSIVVAARNEARDIEAALQSWFQLDYPGMELILVNDRSTDETGAILDRMTEQQSILQVVHLEELPAGWLGKNHALQLGAKRSQSDYLLFTDADVIIQPSALRRAVGYMQQEQLDHLTITPQVAMPTRLLEAFVTVFTSLFLLYFRAWKVSDPTSDAHVGIGAFNLLRRDGYQECGMHQSIAMRPDDDVKLGKIIKQHGLSQALVVGSDHVYVRWYASLKELMVGLEKNVLAGLDYRLWMVFVLSFLLILGMFAPWVAVFLTSGITQVLYGMILVLLLIIFLRTTVELRVRTSCVFWFPVVLLLFNYIIWRATILTYVQGGIRWRDTFYPLSELKKNQV
jgi:glycosyltransferase involved in cell wall biosynthesis